MGQTHSILSALVLRNSNNTTQQTHPYHLFLTCRGFYRAYYDSIFHANARKSSARWGVLTDSSALQAGGLSVFFLFFKHLISFLTDILTFNAVFCTLQFCFFLIFNFLKNFFAASGEDSISIFEKLLNQKTFSRFCVFFIKKLLCYL